MYYYYVGEHLNFISGLYIYIKLKIGRKLNIKAILI